MREILLKVISFFQSMFIPVTSQLSNRHSLGKMGEIEAERFLKRAGLKIIGKNVRVGKFEIDLIAEDGDEIVFIEVKTRRSNKWGYPEASVDYKKQKALNKAGRFYFLKYCNKERTYRFDIIAITCEPEISIEWIKNAF